MSDHGDADEGGSSSVALDTNKPEHPIEQLWSKDEWTTDFYSVVNPSSAPPLSPHSRWKAGHGTPFLRSLQVEDDKPGKKEISIKLNQMTAEEMKQFCVELESPDCDVGILRLTDGRLSERCCSALTSALEAKPSFLRELHLTDLTFPDRQQLYLLCVAVGNERCRIRTLRLVNCGLWGNGCVHLGFAIKDNPSHLKELDLSRNNLGNFGVMILCDRLMDKRCRLKRLKLTSCRLSEENCRCLNNLLMSTSCHLQELDLSGNSLKDDGIEQLSVGLSSPNCKLSILRLAQCEVTDKGCAVLIKALERRPVPLDELDLQRNDFSSEGMMMLNEFKISSGMGESLSGQDLQEEPSKLPAAQSSSSSPSPSSSDDKSDLELDSIRGNTQLEKPEVDKAPSYFTSEVFHEQGRISYRFRGLGPGVFLCQLTGLGFTMTGGGELLYKIIEWDEDLLRASGKLPAGPLFKIEGATNAVSQLHLLHCEQNPATLSNGLSAVHMSDDGMSFLEPLEINDTHVVVDVSHFSSFGLVIDFFKRILNIERSVSSKVLLFHRPTWTEDCQKVNVFLLPRNFPLEEVKSCQENAKQIETIFFCELIENHKYFLQCPESTLVQPETGSKFDSSFGKVECPNFDIRLKRSTKDATVVVKDQDETTVWKYYTELIAQPPASEPSTATLLTDGSGATAASSSTSRFVPPPASEPTTTSLLTDGSGPDPGTQDLQAPMRPKLFSMRMEFIYRVSKSSLVGLMDRLLHQEVISDEEYQRLKVLQPVSNAATELIDTVLKKGERASEVMIKEFSKVDKYLYADLKFQVHCAERR